MASPQQVSSGSSGHRVLEFFLLRQTRADIENGSSELRARVGAALRLGRQRGRASKILSVSGPSAESLRLAAEALDETVLAAEAMAEGNPDNGDSSVGGSTLETWLSEKEIVSLAAARTLVKEGLPTLDREIESEHGDLYRDLVRLRRIVDRVASPAALTTTDVRRLLVGRWVRLMAAVGGLALALVFALGPGPPLVVTASGYHGNNKKFVSKHAFDGDPTTEWLPQHRGARWIEARLSPSRNVKQVRVRNGQNLPFKDRALKRYKIELFGEDGALLESFRGELARPVGKWQELGVAAPGVRRVRLTLLSYYGKGPAIAEIDIVGQEPASD